MPTGSIARRPGSPTARRSYAKRFRLPGSTWGVEQSVAVPSNVPVHEPPDDIPLALPRHTDKPAKRSVGERPAQAVSEGFARETGGEHAHHACMSHGEDRGGWRTVGYRARQPSIGARRKHRGAFATMWPAVLQIGR